MGKAVRAAAGCRGLAPCSGGCASGQSLGASKVVTPPAAPQGAVGGKQIEILRPTQFGDE